MMGDWSRKKWFCFPPNSTSMMWRVDCYPGSREDRKQPRLSLWGWGPSLIGIKEQTWKGTWKGNRTR